MKRLLFLVLLSAPFFLNCTKTNDFESYENILTLLQTKTNPIELLTKDGKSRVIVVPDFQGRVVGSTSTGLEGKSLGWLNMEPLKSGKELNGSELHGEERIWIGPQGSQFSFFYGQEKPFHEDNWLVPASFDGEAFEIVSQSDSRVKMKKAIELTNHIGTNFKMELERNVQILEHGEIEYWLNMSISKSLSIVAYVTEHKLTNKDSVQWKKETGLATIWSLSSFKGSDNTITFIPLQKSHSNSDILQYLNTFKDDRYQIKDNIAWYKTDGKYRSKIGIPPEMSLGYFGNYQPEINILRIIQFEQNRNDSLYFNSNVTIQKEAYNGEAIAVYNNGPMDLGVGKNNSFFELESMAAMKELKPNESIQHFHVVYQFTGDFEKLNHISKAYLGADLMENPLP